MDSTSARISFRRLRNRRGAALVFLALILVALLIICAMVIDLGVAHVAAAQLQNVADAAALAGAGELQERIGAGVAMEEAIRLATEQAVRVAGLNSVLKDSQVIDPDVDVVVGSWDEDAHMVVDWDEDIGKPAVQVTARRTTGSANGPVSTIFAKVIGIQNLQVSRTATAGLLPGVRSTPLELMVVQDASGSFIEEWQDAITADLALVNLINSASIQGDKAGFAAFSDTLKVTTYEPRDNRLLGNPRPVDDYGNTDTENGWVRPLQFGFWDFNYSDPVNLPAEMDRIYELVSKDYPGGYTNPGVAIQWAINQFNSSGKPGADKVIVFVSDGMPFGLRYDATTGERDLTEIYRDRANSAAQDAGELGIKIHSVTLTNESSGAYGSAGADYEFNKDLVEKYNVDKDGNPLGGVAFQTSDPEGLRDLLLDVGNLVLSGQHPRLLK